MPEKTEEIIVIRKRKAHHGGHHGGAWKVAYADFVTAMMSLFIVLWLTSSNEVVKKSVAQYFNDPKGTADKTGSTLDGKGPAIALNPLAVEKLKQRLTEAARRMPDFDKLQKQIEITEQKDGLRIELIEQPGGTFFQLGSSEPTESLKNFLRAIAPELGKMQTRISIEGHTDAVPYGGVGTYTNWELSADRANAARRLMQGNGVSASQVAEVRGFADQMPRMPDAPNDPSNRRVTLIVQPGIEVPGTLPSSEGTAAGSQGELVAKTEGQHASESAAAPPAHPE